MPFQGIEGNVLSGGDAHEESEPHYRGSPESDYVRKRRQRSTSSTEEVTGWSPRRAAGYDGTIVDDRGTPGQSPTSLPHRYSDRHPEPSPINNSDGTSGSSRGLSEDTLTVRRREANRLAAQRFRSRKKGYQDSLEEKVRQLEEDKELLIRRLTEASGVTLPIRRTSTSRHHDDRIDSKNASRSGSSSLNPPASPDHRDMAIDSDVRIASLESANRRLQDELRVINEENDKLREELDYWRRRERDQREASWAIDGARREGMRSPHDISPITDSRHGSTPTDRRNVAPGFPFHNSFPNGLMPTAPNLPLRSPTDTNHPTLPSPGFRLPPIRLPPLKTTSNSIDRAGSTVGPPPYLPRAIELDHVGLAMMQPPVSRPVASSEEDRRRRE